MIIIIISQKLGHTSFKKNAQPEKNLNMNEVTNQLLRRKKLQQNSMSKQGGIRWQTLFNLISTTSSGDHTWIQLIPCWLPGWGSTEGRHLVLMEEGEGGGGKVKRNILKIVFDFLCSDSDLGYIG